MKEKEEEEGEGEERRGEYSSCLFSELHDNRGGLSK